jgi:hypothetical protein
MRSPSLSTTAAAAPRALDQAKLIRNNYMSSRRRSVSRPTLLFFETGSTDSQDTEVSVKYTMGESTSRAVATGEGGVS